MIIAAAIELFGDNRLGWRIGSVLFGLIALIALYALVRAAGGSGWLAAGTAAVASMDNLFLVHSRIGTLDIYAIAMMLISAALYLRRHPIAAGVALGVGDVHEGSGDLHDRGVRALRGSGAAARVVDRTPARAGCVRTCGRRRS